MKTCVSRWYAVHTRNRFEHVVCEALAAKGIESFYPRMLVMSRRRDRHVKIQAPILPGYVFVRSGLEPEEHLNILQTSGIVRFVGFDGSPAPADDTEIASLMILDGTDRTVQNRAYINKGDLVRIMEGPLDGLVGFYSRHKGKTGRVIVSIELLKRSISVEIDDWALERI
jgi:transcription termination/antitermination protein NusG